MAALQSPLDKFSHACYEFGLTISQRRRMSWVKCLTHHHTWFGGCRQFIPGLQYHLILSSINVSEKHLANRDWENRENKQLTVNNKLSMSIKLASSASKPAPCMQKREHRLNTGMIITLIKRKQQQQH